MINYDDVIKEKIKGYNPNWTRNPGHSYRILITGVSGSWRAN